MRRLLSFAFLVVLLFPASAAAAAEPAPRGWTTTVKRLEGSARRLWYLALMTQKEARHVTLVVAPVAQVGQEGAEGEKVERSAAGDLHQIALWAERLRRDAEGWKRPSLRERPPASAHVIGVVRSVSGRARLENAEHGGGDLRVGDLLFVEDVLSSGPACTVGVELLTPENLWHYRQGKAELVFGKGARVGFCSSSDALRLRLHKGDVRSTVWIDDLIIRTDRATYIPAKDATFLLTTRGTGRIDVRTEQVVVDRAGVKTTVAAGSTLTIDDIGGTTVAPLDEARWDTFAPVEPACTRDQALALVAHLKGHWRGQPRNASITLGDDGRWRSYERQPGRSVNRGGAWEPRPGGLVELTYVFTPRRSKTPRTDVFRYLLDGRALVRLRPGGQVFQHAGRGD